MIPKQYELHQSGYLGPYYITTAEEFARRAVIISSDRVVGVGSLEAMEGAKRLMEIPDPSCSGSFPLLSQALVQTTYRDVVWAPGPYGLTGIQGDWLSTAVTGEPKTDWRAYYECETCSEKPGSATLCDRCLEARAAAGSLWLGPLPSVG